MDGTERRLRQLSDEELEAELRRVLRTLRGSAPDRSSVAVTTAQGSASRHGRRASLGSPTVDVGELLRRQALVSRELRRRREVPHRPPDAAPEAGPGPTREGAVVLPFRPRRLR